MIRKDIPAHGFCEQCLKGNCKKCIALNCICKLDNHYEGN